MTSASAAREWDAGRPVDVAATLAPLRRGPGDAAHRIDPDGRWWWACTTPDGDGTLALSAAGARVHAQAFGPGAGWLLERVPRLLGAEDDWAGLDVTTVALLHNTRRRRPGLRLLSTGLVLDSLVPAVLEQKVTGQEAWRAWRLLLQRYGRPAPGPRRDLRVPPDAATLLAIPGWEWHRMGVDAKRQRPVRAAATVAARLEECTAMPIEAAFARLRVLPGVGPWTAAETVQRALGAPDCVSVGDYHLPNIVGWALAGRPRSTDEQMLELLAPWAGHRQRIMRLLELSGVRAPRYGPKFAYTDIRAL